MTNGEKLKEIFPDVKIITQYDNPFGDSFIVFTLNNVDMQVNIDWWNAEYKEPTTRNCFGCRYAKDNHNAGTEECHLCMWENQYTPTTKNDLGVENDLVSSIVEKISEKVTETREEFIFETIRPYCENVVQMKISKRDLEQALLKYYGKNDLVVDCVSRQEVNRLACRYLKEPTNNHVAFYEDFLDLPSVTPQEPKTGHWINKQHLLSSCSAECSSCHKRSNGYVFDNGFSLERKYYDYCPNCGSDNREVEK